MGWTYRARADSPSARQAGTVRSTSTVFPDAEAVYLRLPRFAQHLACSSIGAHTELTRYGASFRRTLDAANKRSSQTDAALRAYRDQRLRAFVRHAAETVPY